MKYFLFLVPIVFFSACSPLDFSAPIVCPTGESVSGVSSFGNGTYAVHCSPNVFYNGTLWFASGSNVYRDTGNVGIGESNPTNKLVVSDSTLGTSPIVRVVLNSVSPSGGMILNNLDTSANSISTYRFSGRDSTTSNNRVMGGISAGKEQLWTSSSGTRNSYLSFLVGSSGSDVERMRITSSGNVGIGTSTPSAFTHWSVSASSSRLFFDSSNAGLQTFAQTHTGLLLTTRSMNPTSKYTPALMFGSTDPDFTTRNPKMMAGIVGYAGRAYSSDGSGGMGMEFFTLGSSSAGLENPTPVSRMILTDSGRLGVRTSSPTYILDVNGTGNIEGTFRVASGNLLIANTVLEKVGIRTINPEATLHVESTLGGSASDIPMKFVRNAVTTSTTQTSMIGKVTTTGDMTDGFGSKYRFVIQDNALVENNIGEIGMMRSGADNSGAFFIDTANTGTLSTKFTILPNGNTGIGTTNPNQRLQVSGNINVSGTVYYGALVANSPHAFLDDEIGYTRICTKATNGVVIMETIEFIKGVYEKVYTPNHPDCNKEILTERITYEEKYDKDKNKIIEREIYKNIWTQEERIVTKDKGFKIKEFGETNNIKEETFNNDEKKDNNVIEENIV